MTSTPTASADGVTIPLPEGWEVVDLPGAQLAIAGPAGIASAAGTQFRPSVNVVVAPAAPDADIRTLATEAVAAAHVVAPGTHVLSYDLWPLGDDVYGRRLQFAYQAGRRAVVRQPVDRAARRRGDDGDRNQRHHPAPAHVRGVRGHRDRGPDR